MENDIYLNFVEGKKNVSSYKVHKRIRQHLLYIVNTNFSAFIISIMVIKYTVSIN
jgi:hypothetical protein